MGAKKDAVEKYVESNYDPALDYAQITNEYMLAIMEDFFMERDLLESPIERDEVLAVAANISMIVEVMDLQKFKKDADYLNGLVSLLNDWAAEIELVNKALGIPREKG